MRRIIRLLLIVCLPPIGWVTTQQTAAAAPAAPYSYNECVSYVYDGSYYEDCFSGQGVVVDQVTPSGNVVVSVFTGKTFYQVSQNGQVIWKSAYTVESAQLISDGSTQASHYTYHGMLYFWGETCDYDVLYTWANGVMRHDTYNIACS
jgi:hypothetical protein